MNKYNALKIILIISCIVVVICVLLSTIFIIKRDNIVSSNEHGLCHISKPLSCENDYINHHSKFHINITINKCNATTVVMDFHNLCNKYGYHHPLSYKGKLYYPNTVYNCFLNKKDRCIWDEDNLLRNYIDPLTNMYILFSTISSIIFVIIIPILVYKLYNDNRKNTFYELL